MVFITVTLIMITFGQTKSDNNNRMIAIAVYFYLVTFSALNGTLLFRAANQSGTPARTRTSTRITVAPSTRIVTMWT